MSGQKNAWLWERVRHAVQHVVVMVYVSWRKVVSIVRQIAVLVRVHVVWIMELQGAKTRR